MEESVIDVAAINGLLSANILDLNFLVQLYTVFERDAGKLIEEIACSVQQCNVSELKKKLHALSGIAGNMHALKLAALCREINTRLSQDDRASLEEDIVGALECSMAETDTVYRDFLNTSRS